MNDYFLKILIRQRHAEILQELNLARLPQPESPSTTSTITRTLQSLFAVRKIPVYLPLAEDESKGT